MLSNLNFNALAAQTAQLPRISLEAASVEPIGTNTVDCMKSGSILGTASMIDGMVERYKEELGPDISVIACGGLVEGIVPHCRAEVHTDENLLLEGLRVLFVKNTAEK